VPLLEENIPAIKPRFHGLDHLRALAIILVFLFHYQYFGHPAWESKIAVFGWTGVDLFFVLSGFLIARELFTEIAEQQSISLKRFFIKRFFRIIPPYLLILILYGSFSILREGGQMSPVWRFLTFTVNFNLDRNHYQVFTHAWSLCIEEQFYLLLPACLLAGCYFKSGKTGFFIIPLLVVTGVFLRYWCYMHHVLPYSSSPQFMAKWYEFIYYPTFNRLDGLLIGVGIAAATIFLPKTNQFISKYSNVLIIIGSGFLSLAYIICVYKTDVETTMSSFPLISLGYGCWVYAVICPSCVIYKLKSRISTEIAALSYAVYLTHKMVIHVMQMSFGDMKVDTNSTLMFVLCIAGSIAIAILMRWLIEKPFFMLRKKILSNYRQ
jgi:peptidoglycan/LPS O-acetylase OafA/YrhL